MTKVPEYLGPYRVTGELGRGGMGTVYRGEHARSGEPVALKLIAGAVADQPRFRRRFANEIETLKKLDHPNIARLLGYGEENGQLFYAMELVDGPSLQEHQRKTGRIPWEDVLTWSIDICLALKHAHDLGVIHRDLKPANLLIGPQGVLKLTDFGIAKLFGAEEATVVGSVVGTADFMAPEQAAGKPVSARSDLYALGSVMYSLLAGRAPFAGGNVTQVIARLQTATPPPLDLICPEAPPELVELIDELLAKDPEQRPPTALAVGNRLRSMREGFRRRSTGGQAQGTETGAIPRADSKLSQSALRSSEPGEPAETLLSQPAQAGIHSAVTASPQGGAITPSTPLPPPSTHFIEVGKEDRRRAATNVAPVEGPKHDWKHLASTVGLAVLLLGAIAGITWLAWPPSADELYAELQAADSRQDYNALGTTAADFLRRFADDPRAGEIRQWQRIAEDQKSLRKLQTGGRLIRSEQEGSAAEALESIIKQQSNEPYRAQQRLNAWLEIYGDPTSPAQASEELRRMAMQLREDWSALPPASSSPQARTLEALIGWIQQKPPAERDRLLNELIDLHGDSPWAESLLDPIRNTLNRPR
jgi:serine/threonine-protein kinase